MWEHSEEFADRAEVVLRPFDYDEPVEMVRPQPDVNHVRSTRLTVANSDPKLVCLPSTTCADTRLSNNEM